MSDDDKVRSRKAPPDDDGGQPDPTAPREGASLSEDSRGLGAGVAGRLAIGFVDEVNGNGAVECRDYRPTFYELRVLAQHWAGERLRHLLNFFLIALTGSENSRQLAFATRRLDRIAAILPQSEFDAAFESAEKEVREHFGMDDELWAFFEKDDETACRGVWREVHEAEHRARQTAVRSSCHLAARLVVGHLSGLCEPSVVYLEYGDLREGVTGRLDERWGGAGPERADAQVRALLAGPLAGGRVLAAQALGLEVDFEQGEPVLPFDPASPDHDLLALGDGREQVALTFLHGGRSHGVPVDAGPFRADVAAVRDSVDRGLTTAGRAAELLGEARRLLNDPGLWADVCGFAYSLMAGPRWKVTRVGLRGKKLARRLAGLDRRL